MRVLTRNTFYRLYTALALVTFHVPAHVYATTPTPLHPAPAARPDCELDLARLARRQEESALFKERYLHNGFVPPADNEAFFRRAMMENDPKEHAYHVEMSILKTLNDKVFDDKELSAAHLNLFKAIFFEELQRNAYLKRHVPSAAKGGVYSDFKSIRLVGVADYKADVERLDAELAEVEKRAKMRFASTLKGFPALQDAYANRKGLLADTVNWHLSGIGDTPAEASLQARRARRPHPGEDRREGVPWAPRRMGSTDILEIAAELREIESLRGKIADKIGDHSGILVDGILTADALDILRRAQGNRAITNQREYVKHIQDRFRQRFGVELDAAFVPSLQRYYHLCNEQAPSIFIKEAEPLALASLENARHGVFTFDMGGQNNRNMEKTMLALRFAYVVSDNPEGADAPTLVRESLNLATEYQVRASDAFDEKKDILSNAIQASGIPGVGQKLGHVRDSESLTKSGDDSTFLPGRPISLADQFRLARNIRDRAPFASLYRGNYQPQNFVDEPKEVPQSARFWYGTQADGAEKAVREKLEGAEKQDWRASYPELKDIGVLLNIHPYADGRVVVDIIYSRGKGAQKVEPEEWERRLGIAIQEAGVLPVNARLGRIYDADSPPPLVP